MFSRIVSVLAALGLVAPSVVQVEPKPYHSALAKTNNVSALALHGDSDGWPPYGPQPPPLPPSY